MEETESVELADAGVRRITTLLSGRLQRHAVLLLLAIVCASVNLNKPVHMDDTAYLEIAQAILQNPLHPMSREINWQQTAEPVFRLNQPHGLICLYALTMWIFGESPLALHVLMALLVLGVIYCFYLLAKLLVPPYALWLTAVVVLGPAFLPGQNLMLDIPLAGLWALFFWALLRPPKGARDYSLAVAAAVASAACLVKYVSLVLLPILLLAILMRRRYRSLWVLGIPVAVLAGWSAFNYLDYGAIHLLRRSIPEFSLRAVGSRTLGWIAGLGAVAFFAPFLITLLESRRLRTGVFFLVLVSGVAVFLRSQSKAAGLSPQIPVLWAVFAGNGILTLALTLLLTAKGALRNAREKDWSRIQGNAILLLWLSGAASFVVLFAPFLAIRHILLALPAIPLLVLYNSSKAVPKAAAVAALTASAFFGLLLACSDYQYANVYRTYAPIVKRAVPGGARLFFAGHWGWQWYARKEGAEQYDAERTILRPGDYVVTTKLLSRARITLPRGLALTKVREWRVPSSLVALFRTMSVAPRGGYYMHRFTDRALPWRLSTAPMETFVLQKVVVPAG